MAICQALVVLTALIQNKFIRGMMIHYAVVNPVSAQRTFALLTETILMLSKFAIAIGFPI